jgi:hypothetical protein
MNINITLKCDTCNEYTNCRIGISNRAEQPLRFCCQDCGAPIEFLLVEEVIYGEKEPEFTGATIIQPNKPFDEETNFVELHLDFPVHFGKYVQGDTPFMKAAARSGVMATVYHGRRLAYLDAKHAKFGFFKTLLKLYAKEKWLPFKNTLEKHFDKKATSDKMMDLNDALYHAIAEIMAPFLDFSQPDQIVDDEKQYLNIQNNLAKKNKVTFDAFIDEILKTEFLKNLQIDCLEIYPKILSAELPLRPVLFLDFDNEHQDKMIPMRVSVDQFDTYKDLYKDISEIISRQLVLVAGLNNLLKRDDHNAFKSGIGATKAGKDNTPKNLNDFANVSFGKKLDYIDDNWFIFSNEATDNQLRNAIAHFKTDYDEVTQKITYYPRIEGMKEDKSEEMYFLEFMRRIIIVYREMNRLHQLVKCLFYHHYLSQE